MKVKMKRCPTNVTKQTNKSQQARREGQKIYLQKPGNAQKYKSKDKQETKSCYKKQRRKPKDQFTQGGHFKKVNKRCGKGTTENVKPNKTS